MITIKRNEEVEIFQVELSLKLKTKQSPFIAILILSQEQEEVSAETLQQYLLPSLPVRACYNLLRRLQQQGYLKSDDQIEITEERIKEIYRMHENNYERTEKYLENLVNENRNINSYFTLTDLGQRSATDKSFWIGEKGVYNVFVSKSNLIEQRIIRTEKTERAEDNRNSNIYRTPTEIRQYENKILTINKTEVLIEDVEEKCFQLKPANCILEIQAKGNESVLKLSKDNQLLFQTDIAIEENILQAELLTESGEFEYDEDKKAILTEFSKDNLSFNRKAKIVKPIFERNQFNQVELENILHIPSDKKNAELWLNELLYKGIDKYFLDDNSFAAFAIELAKPIRLYYEVGIPKRKELAELFSERIDSFYQIAKLETIDYLNY